MRLLFHSHQLMSGLEKCYISTGLTTFLSCPRDVKLLCLQRFVRLFAFGSSTLILVLFLSLLGNSKKLVGLFLTLTLVGDVVLSLLTTAVADAVGRRRLLVVGSVLMTMSGLVFATSSSFMLLLLASILGIISPR